MTRDGAFYGFASAGGQPLSASATSPPPTLHIFRVESPPATTGPLVAEIATLALGPLPSTGGPMSASMESIDLMVLESDPTTTTTTTTSALLVLAFGLTRHYNIANPGGSVKLWRVEIPSGDD